MYKSLIIKDDTDQIGYEDIVKDNTSIQGSLSCTM